MTEKDELMVLLSIMLLKLSKSGVIVLDMAHNAEHTEVGGFIAKEFRSYLQDEHGIPEVKYNLAVAFKNIAFSAIFLKATARRWCASKKLQRGESWVSWV